MRTKYVSQLLHLLQITLIKIESVSSRNLIYLDNAKISNLLKIILIKPILAPIPIRISKLCSCRIRGISPGLGLPMRMEVTLSMSLPKMTSPTSGCNTRSVYNNLSNQATVKIAVSFF